MEVKGNSWTYKSESERQSKSTSGTKSKGKVK